MLVPAPILGLAMAPAPVLEQQPMEAQQGEDWCHPSYPTRLHKLQ